MSLDVALLFSGEVRSLEGCLSSIKKLFPNNPDIYCHTYLDEDCFKAELLKPQRLVIEPAKWLVERKEYHQQLGRHCYGVQNMLQQLYTLKRVWEIYTNSGIKHKWIIRCRYDEMYKNELEEDYQSWDCDLIVPKHDHWWGYNDRFGLMRYDVAKDYFTRLDKLDDYINKGGIMHHETFLKSVMEKYKVCYTRVESCTLRKSGRIRKPTYRAHCGDVVC